MRIILVLFALALGSSVVSAAERPSHSPSSNELNSQWQPHQLACARARQGITTLQTYYDQSTGSWGCGLQQDRADEMGWWNCANSLEVLARYTINCEDATFIPVIETTWQKTAAKFPSDCIQADSNDDVGMFPHTLQVAPCMNS